jgi:hypothetical protein
MAVRYGDHLVSLFRSISAKATANTKGDEQANDKQERDNRSVLHKD